MILKGNSRGGAKDLALHLVKEDNDHVEVHELRGFAARDLMGALNEAYAISRGTRCQAFLYSLSINPPPNEKVATSELIAVADRAEKALGLAGQPRALVFHEKEGRRHAHVVWSRIRIQDMKAIRMSYDRTKLQTISRDLFLEHGWRMPEGIADRSKSDPRHFTLADWQQAKRNGQDPKTVKAAIQDAWAVSDSLKSLQHALEERGHVLARGDRRSFVCVDMFGEVRSLPRMAGVKTKDVRSRLGNGDDLPDVETAKDRTARTLGSSLKRVRRGLEKDYKRGQQDFLKRKAALLRLQRAEREQLIAQQKRRWTAESQARQARFRKGLKGLWDGLRGHNRRLRLQNQHEAQACRARDQLEKDNLIHAQLAARGQLKVFALSLRDEFVRSKREIEQELNSLSRLHNRGPDLS